MSLASPDDSDNSTARATASSSWALSTRSLSRASCHDPADPLVGGASCDWRALRGALQCRLGLGVGVVELGVDRGQLATDVLDVDLLEALLQVGALAGDPPALPHALGDALAQVAQPVMERAGSGAAHGVVEPALARPASPARSAATARRRRTGRWSRAAGPAGAGRRRRPALPSTRPRPRRPRRCGNPPTMASAVPAPASSKRRGRHDGASDRRSAERLRAGARPRSRSY